MNDENMGLYNIFNVGPRLFKLEEFCLKMINIY